MDPYRPGLGAAYYITKYVLKEAAQSGYWGLYNGGVTDDNYEGWALDGCSVPHGVGRHRSGEEEEARWKTQAQVEEDIDEAQAREEALQEWALQLGDEDAGKRS